MRAFIGALIAAAFVATPALALEPLDVMRGSESNSCSASTPVNFFRDGSAGISVKRSHYLLVLMLAGTAEQIPPGMYSVSLTLDDQPPVKFKASGGGGVYVAYLDIKLAMALRNAKKLTLHARGEVHEFDGSRMGEVMDAAGKCAGIPTVSDFAAIGFGNWAITPGGKDDAACHAIRHGLQVDSMASLYPDGRFTFGAAWMGWKLKPGKLETGTLEIDEDPPKSVVLATSVKTASLDADKEFLDRLEKASSLTWNLPWGEFYSEVNGIADMRKSLSECMASRH